MKLSTLLKLTPGDRVAVVGCGGKTALIDRLALEAAESGVLIAPTTRIGLDQMMDKPGIAYLGRAEGSKLCAVPLEEILAASKEYALTLMEADGSGLRHRTDFNLAAMSFSAGELAAEIRKHLPDFVCTFEPDHRQAIADSWPRSIDDSAARAEWGWQPKWDLARMTKDMLRRLTLRHREGRLYPQAEGVERS